MSGLKAETDTRFSASRKAFSLRCSSLRRAFHDSGALVRQHARSERTSERSSLFLRASESLAARAKRGLSVVSVYIMLHDRRVASGLRQPLSSYARPLCLIVALLHGNSWAAAAPVSNWGARRGRVRVAVASGGGGDVGVKVARPWGIATTVWTAASAAAAAAAATTAVHVEGSGRLMLTATASAEPSANAQTSERASRLLLSVRGGSEGLKRAEWHREKAEAGWAARERIEPSGGVGEVMSVCTRICGDLLG